MIALLAALLGGGIGAGASVVTTTLTVQAQEEQTLEQYRREKRVDIYAAINRDATNALNVSRNADAQLSLNGFLEDSPRPPDPNREDFTPQLQKMYTDWQAAYNTLDGTIANAEMYGSRDVLDLAKALRDRIQKDFYATFVDGVLRVNMLPADLADKVREASLTTWDPLPSETYDRTLFELPSSLLKDMYLKAAKEDLGLND